MLIYDSQIAALEKMTPEDVKTAILGMAAYAMRDESPDLTGAPAVFLEMAKPYINNNNKKYENAKRRKQNRLIESKPEQTGANRSKPEQTGTTVTVTDTVTDTVKDKKKDIVLDKSDPVYPYAEVIGYLNQKTGANYQAKSKDTRKHIKARFDEGFTLDDFKTVIDKKTAEWSKDPEMVAYLRPSTLFGTKFESYLNQQVVKGKPKNRFNNFPQRDYDFGEFEKQLLSASLGGG